MPAESVTYMLDLSRLAAWDSVCFTLANTSLPYSPVKLILLIAWVYLCLYCVQRIQFNPLVSPRYKVVSIVASLFIGPFYLLVLLLIVSGKRAIEGKSGFLEALQEHAVHLIKGIGGLRVTSPGIKDELELLNASGTSIHELYGQSSNARQSTHTLGLTAEIIGEALDNRATDVLIDPQDESSYLIRHRVDGVLRPVRDMSSDTSKAVVNSIKAVSSMDISEKRRPQDGAFLAKRSGVTASFRVASAGALNGEKLSIRLLNYNASGHTLKDTGLSTKQLRIICKAVAKPTGMILVCGPTGSGKTSTLYAMLNEMDRFTRNVITIEDPVEAVLPETSQIEINAKADITFAQTLRSILRQDPDVICVGEIRDEETAEIALRAAQTGHLVFATLHCDSNAAAIIRLLDLGVSPLLVASGLRLLLSQRLIRCLCEKCKTPAHLSQVRIRDLKRKNINPERIYQAAGCRRCNKTGYYGRTAVADITIITDQMKADIAANKGLVDELRTVKHKKGKASLHKQALRKLVSGQTSFEEIKRVIG
jgi:general secretion pathway protein E